MYVLDMNYTFKLVVLWCFACWYDKCYNLQ